MRSASSTEPAGSVIASRSGSQGAHGDEDAGTLAGAAVTTRLAHHYGSARSLVLASAFSAALALLMPLATYGPALVLFGLGNADFAVSRYGIRPTFWLFAAATSVVPFIARMSAVGRRRDLAD